jgi:putative endonuclease
MTNDLKRRLYEHKEKLIEGFSKKYNLCKLVYFEEYQSPQEAIAREKQLKKWKRDKKNALIDTINCEWNDFSKNI